METLMIKPLLIHHIYIYIYLLYIYIIYYIYIQYNNPWIMENPIYLSTVPCSFHCCRIRWAHRPFLEPVAVEPIVRRSAAKKVILAACKADLNSSDYIYIYIYTCIYICMYVCERMYVCIYIYIFCNVLMDGMEWNGMAWKGREGKGMVS